MERYSLTFKIDEGKGTVPSVSGYGPAASIAYAFLFAAGAAPSLSNIRRTARDLAVGDYRILETNALTKGIGISTRSVTITRLT
jgi:hypothetical protein